MKKNLIIWLIVFCLCNFVGTASLLAQERTFVIQTRKIDHCAKQRIGRLAHSKISAIKSRIRIRTKISGRKFSPTDFQKAYIYSRLTPTITITRTATSNPTITLTYTPTATRTNSPTATPTSTPILESTIAGLPSFSGVLAGSVAGSLEVSQSGAATYSIPLALPPGVNGLIPQLSFSYDSTNGDGLLAHGWTLSGLSAIGRCPSTIAQDGIVDGVDFDSNDRFCLDGQRLVLTSGTYAQANSEYRTEQESFSKIVASSLSGSAPASFTVYGKDGSIDSYSTLGQPQSDGTASYWLLTESRDRSNNRISYEYKLDSQNKELLPSLISYGGSSPDRNSSVSFEYEDRTNPRTNLGVGPLSSAKKRISRVVVKSAGSTAWEYKLAYSPAAGNSADRLVTIQECDSTGYCLPATRFEWGGENVTENEFGQPALLNDLSEAQGFFAWGPSAVGDFDGDGRSDVARVDTYSIKFYRSTDAGLVFYTQLNDLGWDTRCYGSELIVGDWNGDGRSDIARDCSFDGVKFYTSTNSGFSYMGSVNSIAVSFGRYTKKDAYPFVTGDWNGDGRTDIARVMEEKVMFLVSNGAGFLPYAELSRVLRNQEANGTAFSKDCDSQSLCPIFTGDWNGDGLTDFAKVNIQGGIEYYHNENSTFVPTFRQYGTLAIGATRRDYSSATGLVITGDWNGDGLTDLAKLGKTAITFCNSNGSYFDDCAELYDFSPSQGYFDIFRQPIITGDWNRDGKTDIARAHNSYLYFYNRQGNGFGPSYVLADFTSSQGYDDLTAFPFVVGDWNGDGFTDIGRISRYGVTTYKHKFDNRLLLAKVTDGLGAQTKISYGLLTDNALYSKDQSALYPAVEIQAPISIVSSISTSNALGTTTDPSFSTISYHYSGLKADLNGRGYSGFSNIIIKDEQTGISTRTSYLQAYPLKQIPFLKEQRLANGTLISRTRDSWAVKNFSNGTYLNILTQSVSEQFELGGSLIRKTTTDKTYDDWGNVTIQRIKDEDGYTENIFNTYLNDIQTWTIGRLTRSVVSKMRPGQVELTRTSEFVYSLTSNEIGSGYLISEIIEPDSPTLKVQKNYNYDNYGNKVKETIIPAGEAERSINYVFPPDGKFPIQVINAIGHVVSLKYDDRFGQVVERTDANGLVTKWEYDGFGRLLRERRADGTQTRTVYLISDTSADLANASYFIRTDSSGQPPKVSIFDELGREIRKEETGFNGNKIFVDTVYDERGQISHVSSPYFSSGTPTWTIKEYDVLGREIKTIEPGNRVTSVGYNGLVVTNTNPRRQITTQAFDSRGLLIWSRDDANGVVNFIYNSEGNLTSISDPAGNKTTITYDSRGNRTQILDPDSGLSTFSYNGLGQVRTQRNAKGETTTFNYDLIGRVISRQSGEGTMNWTYDVASYGVGKLAHISASNGYEEHFYYDSLERLRENQKKIKDSFFTVRQGYDQYSRPTKLTYPSGYSVDNIYNGYGFISEIRQANGALLWVAQERNAAGQLQRQQFGNGVQTQQIFDSQTKTVRKIQTTGLQDLEYKYDVLDNLTERSDLRINLSESFAYDNLNRLIKSQVAGQEPVIVSYDALGNITSKSDIGIYSYDIGMPHAVKQITGSKPNNYNYDENGNRIVSSQGGIEYTASGKPKLITYLNARLENEYNIDGEQLEQRNYYSGTLISKRTFVGSLYEREERGNVVKDIHYISGPDGVIARYSEQTGISASAHVERLQYLHKDHLGSVQCVSDETGRPTETLSFDSWGKRRNASDWRAAETQLETSLDRGFTGHRQLDSVNLIDMGGRNYDPEIGRFISPDPFVQAPQNLQNLNRYSYVLNNPLSYTDPTGFFFKKLFKSATKFFRKAIPIVAAVVVAYYAGPFFSYHLGAGCYVGVQAAAVSAVSAGLTAFTASVAGSLSGGSNLQGAIKTGIRGAMMGAATGGANYFLDQAFPSWNSMISDVVNNNGSLDVVRPDGAFGSYAAGLGARAVAHGAITETFGGQFVKGFKGSLTTSSARWALDYLNEREFVSEWKERWATISTASGDLKDNMVKDGFPFSAAARMNLLKNMGTSLRVASAPGSEIGVKGPLLFGIIDPFVNNVGKPGSQDFWRGEAGGLLSFIGQNIPGIQSGSHSHDFFIVSIERRIGDGTILQSISKSTIPPVIFAAAWAGGYREARNQLLTASR